MARARGDLVDEEPRESFRYFTRQIDFDALRDRPFWERIPMATWQIFQAMAYRLSPARRLLFAVGVPVVAVAWVRFILDSFGGGGLGFRVDWTLVAATLLLFLLVLELRDKLALKGDLEIAREIQFGLLPFEPFSRGKVTVNSMMRPANTVGGDYFDLIELGDGRIGLVMADVAGKGIPAALLMALLQASLRTLLTASLRGAELIAKLNEHLHSYIPSNRLITLFYAELDPETGDVSYVNAGHNPPLLVGSGGVSRLHSTGLVLGVVPDGDYEMRRTQLEEGDRLVLYTDGATEAFNRQDEEYGETAHRFPGGPTPPPCRGPPVGSRRQRPRVQQPRPPARRHDGDGGRLRLTREHEARGLAPALGCVVALDRLFQDLDVLAGGVAHQLRGLVANDAPEEPAQRVGSHPADRDGVEPAFVATRLVSNQREDVQAGVEEAAEIDVL